MSRHLAILARWSFLAVSAALVMVVQTDRQAVRDPAMIAAVPPAFRVIAQQSLSETQIALRAADAEAVAGTRHLVRLRPIPAHSLLLHAQTAQLASVNDQVLVPLEIAAQRGWREPLLQVLAGRAALASADWASATNRFAALVATGRAPDQANLLLADLLQNPDGRAQLADLLGRPGHYSPRLWERYSQVGTPAQVLDVARRVRDRTIPLDCSALGQIGAGWRLADLGNAADTLAGLGC